MSTPESFYPPQFITATFANGVNKPSITDNPSLAYCYSTLPEVERALDQLSHFPEFSDYTLIEEAYREAMVGLLGPTKYRIVLAVCEACEARVNKGLQLMECSGGAMGLIYLCPTHYAEHQAEGGNNGDQCEACSRHLYER